MYEQDNTTNTWACINAIPISKAENAIIKLKGNNATIKYKKPEFIILYVNPLKIFNNMWPDSILAANLKPRDTFLAKYEINSIKTSKGNKANGQPAGTNNEKNLDICITNPNTVAPITIQKLNEKVNIKWEVEAKLYGTIPTKLLANINRNNVYIKGKNIWPLFSFIWFITIPCTVAYTDSWLALVLLHITL